MKILLLVDKPNWAFHSIAKNLIKFNTDTDLNLSWHAIKGQEKNIKKIYKKHDLFYVMGIGNYERINFLPKKATMIGIHSCHEWDHKKTLPTRRVKPDKKTIDYINSFLRSDAVSKYLYDLFKECGAERIYYTPNGVDSDVFSPSGDIPKEFTIGYSGTKTHDWRKGITEFIIPAAKKANVKVNLAMRATGTHIPLEEMPSFYSTLSAYVCASASEGFSLSVLEAASCGVPIISTKITGCIELIEDGYNGFLVDRTIQSIADKISVLKNDSQRRKKMSKNMRESIVKYHSWDKKINYWLKFLRG